MPAVHHFRWIRWIGWIRFQIPSGSQTGKWVPTPSIPGVGLKSKKIIRKCWVSNTKHPRSWSQTSKIIRKCRFPTPNILGLGPKPQYGSNTSNLIRKFGVSNPKMVLGHNLHYMAPFAIPSARFCMAFQRASFVLVMPGGQTLEPGVRSWSLQANIFARGLLGSKNGS